MSIAVRGFPLRARPDDDVFGRALHNDPVAFAELYRRYRSRIYGFCLSLLLSPAAAEDATQEVFLRLVSSPPVHVEHPRAWLFGVARNVCADAIRKRMNVAREESLEEDPQVEAAALADDSLEETLARETAQNVFLALRRLNPRYRTALILRDIHGESSASIAEVLGTTAGAVDTLASRARDSFGRTYAAVSGMPPACREAVTLAYKATGTGLTGNERARLEAHLAECPACRREAERAHDAHGLSALLPLLAASSGRRVFAEAATVLQGAPMQIAEQTPAFASGLTRVVEGLVATFAAGALLVAPGSVPTDDAIPQSSAVVWEAAGAVAAWSAAPAVARRASERLGDAGPAEPREQKQATIRATTRTRAGASGSTAGGGTGQVRHGDDNDAGASAHGGSAAPGTGAGAGTGNGGTANGGGGGPVDASGASGGSPAADAPESPGAGAGNTAPSAPRPETGANGGPSTDRGGGRG